MREEQQDEVEAWKTTKSKAKNPFSWLREETTVETSILRSVRYSTAARHELLASIRRVINARKERKYKASDTLGKLRKIHDNGRMVMMEAPVTKCSDLQERVACLTDDLKSKSSELQILLGMVAEAARLQQEFSEVHWNLESRGMQLVSMREVRQKISAG